MEKLDIVDSDLIKQFGSFFDEYTTEIVIGVILVIVLFYFLKEKNVIHLDKLFENNLSDKLFEQHFYINLEHRKDRNEDTINKLKKIGINNPKRFNAIKHEIGIVGCAMSHIAVIEKAKKLNWDYVIVFEDDLLINNEIDLLRKFEKYINYDFDVLYLGCWHREKPIKIEDDLTKVVYAQCMHAYIVKKHYYDTILKNLYEGLNLKIKAGKDKHFKRQSEKYNNDVYIKSLQKKDKWYSINPIHITQKDGWSDNFNEIRNLSKIIKHIPTE